MEEKLEKILLDLNIGYITVKVAKRKILRLFAVSEQSEQLVNFLFHLKEKDLINDYDFDYEKEVKKYLKKIK